MKTIWKFPLAITDEQTIEAPRGLEPLSVQVQGGQLCLWALVESSAQPEQVTVRIYGTGHPALAADPRQYVGTVQTGPLVWHVFVER